MDSRATGDEEDPIEVVEREMEDLKLEFPMADFFKNNPIALRHCLLYVFLHEQLFDEAFDNFCETVGSDIIEKEEFRLWFDQFEQGIFVDEEQPIPDMRGVLRRGRDALRVCISFESLKYRKLEKRIDQSYSYLENPSRLRYTEHLKLVYSRSFAMYDNFCRVIGDDVMEFREFDFWFYRFLNGEFDLNYERDVNQKFYDGLPKEIKKIIQGKLNIFERLAMVDTSRKTRKLVKIEKLSETYFGLYMHSEVAIIEFGSAETHRNAIEYLRSADPLTHWRQAALRFSKMLKILINPKLQLEHLKIQLQCGEYDAMEKYRPFLTPLSNEYQEQIFDKIRNSMVPIEVKSVYIGANNLAQLLKVLPSLEPGYLQSITADVDNIDDFTMEKLVKMEQWKQAKMLKMTEYVGPLRHLYHFKTFKIYYFEKLSVQDIREMKEILFKSPNFESATFVLCSPVDNMEGELGDAVEEEPDIYHHPIPNSTEYFEIIVSETGVEISRKKYE